MSCVAADRGRYPLNPLVTRIGAGYAGVHTSGHPFASLAPDLPVLPRPPPTASFETAPRPRLQLRRRLALQTRIPPKKGWGRVHRVHTARTLQTISLGKGPIYLGMRRASGPGHRGSHAFPKRQRHQIPLNLPRLEGPSGHSFVSLTVHGQAPVAPGTGAVSCGGTQPLQRAAGCNPLGRRTRGSIQRGHLRSWVWTPETAMAGDTPKRALAIAHRRMTPVALTGWPMMDREHAGHPGATRWGGELAMLLGATRLPGMPSSGLAHCMG